MFGEQLEQAAADANVDIEFRVDSHFYCSIDEFTAYADGRKSLLLEFFYREMRKKHDVLMEDAKQPEGGQWNFDHDNRESFGKDWSAGCAGSKEVPPGRDHERRHLTCRKIASPNIPETWIISFCPSPENSRERS